MLDALEFPKISKMRVFPYLSPMQSLGVLALLLNDAASSISALRSWGDMDTDSMATTGASEGPWTIDSVQDTDTSKATFSELALTNMRSLLEGSHGSSLAATSHLVSAEDYLASEPDNANAAAAQSLQLKNETGRRGPTFGRIVAVILSVACLGLLAARPRLASDILGEKLFGREKDEQQGKKMQQHKKEDQTQEDQRSQEEHQRSAQQPIDERGVGQMLLLDKLEDLQRLRPLAKFLADTLGEEDKHALAAVQDAHECFERAKQVQRKVLTGSSEHWGYPEDVLQHALASGVSAVSRLCEAARQQGLRTAQQMCNVQRPAAFSILELDTLATVDQSLTDSLVYLMGNITFAYQASTTYASKARRELKYLPALTGVESGGLLAAVATDAALLKGALEAAEAGRRSTFDLKAGVTAFMLSHFVREQVCQYRECRDLLEGQRLLCSVERQRQQSLAEKDTTVLETLDKLEGELDRGDQLLKRYYEEIENLLETTDIESAVFASKPAKGVGGELMSLVEAVSSHLSSIVGTAEEANAVQDADVHHVMERVASRATQEAAVAATRTQDILKEVLSWGVPEEARMETQLTHDNRDSMKHRFSNPCILEELHRELQLVTQKAYMARDKALAAAAKIQQERDGGLKRMMQLVEDARDAAMHAESCLGHAEMLRLFWQLSESLEDDVKQSANLARRAAAAAELSHQQQMWDSEVSSKRMQIEAVIKQVNALQDAARAKSDIKSLAGTTAALKGAVIQLVTLIQDDQQNRTEELLI